SMLHSRPRLRLSDHRTCQPSKRSTTEQINRRVTSRSNCGERTCGSMRITFTESAWADYVWIQENDRKLLRRVNQLIRDTTRSPLDGIGKHEPLKGNLTGRWSRRINDEHRLVYEVDTKVGSSFRAVITTEVKFVLK